MATIRIRNTGERIEEQDAVRAFLTSNNVYYDFWNFDKLPEELKNKFVLTDEEKNQVLETMSPEINALAKDRGYVKWDIITLSDSTPDLDTLLKKFEQVHTHTEDEVRVIAGGSGVFVIKGSDEVGYFDVELSVGDVISVPENNPHFFTLTDERKVVAIRLFIDPSGWVAHPFQDPSFTK